MKPFRTIPRWYLDEVSDDEIPDDEVFRDDEPDEIPDYQTPEMLENNQEDDLAEPWED
jgi:hypothetical protein